MGDLGVETLGGQPELGWVHDPLGIVDDRAHAVGGHGLGAQVVEQARERGSHGPEVFDHLMRGQLEHTSGLALDLGVGAREDRIRWRRWRW